MRILVFLLVLGAAACADKPAGVQGEPPDTAGGKPDLSHPEVGARVLVTIGDSAITLSHDSVQAVGTGQITFAVENKSKASHEFKIEGNELGEWKSMPIPTGQTILMSMLLGRGDYELLWPEDGSGLKKTITIY